MKKRIIIICSILAVLVLVGAGIGGFINHQNNKVFKVALYNLEDEIKNPLKEIIIQNYDGKLKFDDLAEKDFNAKKIAKKYDLYFSWNGNSVEQLAKYSKDIPAACSQMLISTVDKKNALPILLNHYELAYLTKARERAGVDFPSDFEEYMAYLFE